MGFRLFASRSACPVLLAFFALAQPHTARAQLRPIPEVDWGWLEGSEVSVGGAAYVDARAPLAGLEGELYEVGDVRVRLGLGGAALDMLAAYRVFHPEHRYTLPAPDTRDRGDRVLTDFSDVLVETLIPIGLPGPFRAGARIGLRVPSSDNTVGLDRDEADIFGTMMFGAFGSRARGWAEVGLGVYGSRSMDLEQQDVLLYVVILEAGPRTRALRLGIVGRQFWLNEWSAQGNENLGEIHAGLRLGATWVVDFYTIVGYEATSPAFGAAVRVGRRF